MGSLNASVMCRCVQDGIIELPKKYLSVYTKLKKGDFSLDISTLKKHQLVDDFYDWANQCCEHEGLDIIDVEIGRYIVMRSFKRSLSDLATKHDKQALLLLSYIPDWEGCSSAEDALLIKSSVESVLALIDKNTPDDIGILEDIKAVCQCSIDTQNYINWYA